MSDERYEDTLPGDLRIRRMYEAVATERTPASLDAAVLAGARQLPQSRRTRRWIQPFAVAASTVLCLGLVMQLVFEPESPDSVRDPANPGSAGVHQAAIESRAKKLGALQREKAGATATPFDDSVPTASDIPVGHAEPPACSPEDRSDPADWLACIHTLESTGKAELAELERASLLREHPAFNPVTE